MSASRERPDYETGKAMIQCRACGAWMKHQGLNGHERLFHRRNWRFERALVALLSRGDTYAYLLAMKDEPLSPAQCEALLARYQLKERKNSGTSTPARALPGTQPASLVVRQAPTGRASGRPGSTRNSRRSESSGRSRSRAECPVCHREMGRQGLQGHLMFRHPGEWILRKALKHLVEIGDAYACSIVASGRPIDRSQRVILLHKYQLFLERIRRGSQDG